jgi:Ca2+-binding EF-hand superfamily protein
MSGNHSKDEKSCKHEASCKDCKKGKSCKHHSGAHDKGSKEFSAADKDSDGTLDRKEAKKIKNVYKNFDAIDVDKDGTVDRDEVHNFMSGH